MDSTAGESIGSHDVTLTESWDRLLRSHPDRDAINYRGLAITRAALDDHATRMAAAYYGIGVRSGDVIALYLQNQPEFVVAALAAWRVGAAVLPINPMNRERELRLLLADSGATTLIMLSTLWPVARSVLHESRVNHVILVPESDSDIIADEATQVAGDIYLHRWHEILDDASTPDPAAAPGHGRQHDTALLVYTSGTTGPPKAAQITHANLTFSANAWRQMLGVTEDDVVLAIAPLFHITGLATALAQLLVVGSSLVVDFRFDADRMLELAESHRATVTVGATSAFIALMASDEFDRRDISSLTKIISGGAPIPAPVLSQWRERTGVQIRPAYGLTEVTGVGLCTPASEPVRVTADGTVSVGVAPPGTACRLVDSEFCDVRDGCEGEIVLRGPQVMAGYLNRPDETAGTLRDGWLRTGDIGVRDEDSWMYIVDRAKDQINASGFKVWPREVEDVLYEHPAVREAAVVGVADAYRGETVKAFVSLHAGMAVTESELIGFAKDRLAAYKYPRVVEVVEELPKTISGKILRRELRQ